MWRRGARGLEVLLGHFGGPLWAKRDAGAWAIPKGLIEEGEDAQSCARREFEEEIGLAVEGDFTPLGEVRQVGGKVVTAWALERDLDASSIRSNAFTLEWPPKSGRFQSYPEIDRAAWFTIAEARTKILASQLPLIELLLERF